MIQDSSPRPKRGGRTDAGRRRLADAAAAISLIAGNFSVSVPRRGTDLRSKYELFQMVVCRWGGEFPRMKTGNAARPNREGSCSNREGVRSNREIIDPTATEPVIAPA
jgi:hypothetical protein